MSRLNPLPELLAPAGSVDAAYHAFAAGADAVYFGLRRFSARASAHNFDLDDARRLRGLARASGKRIYAAVNTIVFDNELADLSRTAAFLDYLEVDAVIVQDWGVADFFRTRFPHLVLHASTQTAIHDTDGVRNAADAGIERVILPREMTLLETAALVRACPTMQFEVFIHGSQCYGFSGLCLASGVLAGRSANRGRCAQICRSWVTAASNDAPPAHGRRSFAEALGGETARATPSAGAASTAGGSPPAGAAPTAGRPSPRLYPFSANDKSLGADVAALSALGVAGLKIEGRMKSPAYVRAVVGWYRRILDGIPTTPAAADAGTFAGMDTAADPGTPQDPSTVCDNAEVELRTTFARDWTPGFFADPKGARMINAQYPGATGVIIGRVGQSVARRPSAFAVDARPHRGAARPIDEPSGVHAAPGLVPSPRDGVLVIVAGEPVAAAVRSVSQGPHGEVVLVVGRTDNSAPIVPDRGSSVRLISRHDADLPRVKSESLPLHRPEIDVAIGLRGVPVGGRGAALLRVSCAWLVCDYPVVVSPAEQPDGLRRQLTAVFSHHGPWYAWVARPDPSVDGWFVPASLLKRLRRDWIGAADAGSAVAIAAEGEAIAVVHDVESRDESAATAAHAAHAAAGPAAGPMVVPGDGDLPLRRELVVNGLPFMLPGAAVAPWQTLAERAGWSALWIPLAPVTLGAGDRRNPWGTLDAFLAQADRPPVVLGLGNAGALNRYRQHWSRLPRVSAFLDYGLYAANALNLAAMVRWLPRLVGRVPWVERDHGDGGSLGANGASVGGDPGTPGTSAGPIPAGECVAAAEPMPTSAAAPAARPPLLDIAGFAPPLFISRVCRRREHQGGQCGDCRGTADQPPWVWQADQPTARYSVRVQQCWSFVFADTTATAATTRSGTGTTRSGTGTTRSGTGTTRSGTGTTRSGACPGRRGDATVRT